MGSRIQESCAIILAFSWRDLHCINALENFLFQVYKYIASQRLWLSKLGNCFKYITLYVMETALAWEWKNLDPCFRKDTTLCIIRQYLTHSRNSVNAWGIVVAKPLLWRILMLYHYHLVGNLSMWIKYLRTIFKQPNNKAEFLDNWNHNIWTDDICKKHLWSSNFRKLRIKQNKQVVFF